MFGKVTFLALLLFLTACSPADSSQTPAGATALSPVETLTPTATVSPAEPTTTTGGESTTAEPMTMMTEDDRPSQLRAITADWNTNWNRHTIDYGEILSGGPPRDGIPSIDEPVFISPEEAADWLAGNEPVMALTLNEETRAYPLQILTWHEIVNDTVGGVPVVVTYCPLCNSAIVFERRVDGDVYEFGTSGLLRHSDLIMYDRTTESLWQQLTGEGIVGDLAGKQLDFLPASIVSFDDFRAATPAAPGLVLSRETGYSRRYGQNPYVGYDASGATPFLFQDKTDGRLPAMERVVTVSLNGVEMAYPLSVLAEAGVINDRQGGQEVVVFYAAGTSSALDAATIAEGADVGATGVFDPHLDGRLLTFQSADGRLVDEQTGSHWNILGQATDGPLAGQTLTPIVHGDHFWFAWAAFKSDTIIYRNP